MQRYEDFLLSKRFSLKPCGIEVSFPELHPRLFDFQKAIVQWALRLGRAAIFADCGLGKSFMELEWANQIGGNVLILTPLAVAQQFVREGQYFGIPCRVVRSQADCCPGISITNYEMLQHFDSSYFQGIVIDESSILKNYSGATKQAILEFSVRIPYRLAATATPSPNDHMELGNHAEFLGVCSRTEMLAEYFVHDGGSTSQWRLKGHAVDAFWRFVASWAVTLRKPSDIGYSDEGYNLPPLMIHEHCIDFELPSNESLLPEARSMNDQRRAKRASMTHRVNRVAQIVADTTNNDGVQPWLLWGELIDECDLMEKNIPFAVQVAGKHSNEVKEALLFGFIDGKYIRLVSKVKIAGFGLNLQHCSHMVFVGLTHSYEQVYQAIRRCWRFGQKNPVHVHFIYAPAEEPILRNLRRKEAQAETMQADMVRLVQMAHGISTGRVTNDYEAEQPMILPEWIRP